MLTLVSHPSRYFVLTSTRVAYFTDVTRSDLKGEFVITDISSILPYSAARRECGFEVTAGGRVYVIAADTIQEKNAWVDAISAVSGITPEKFQFAENFKGWLWKKADKSSAFKRLYFVLAQPTAKEKRFSTATFSGVPPPPVAGDSGDAKPVAAEAGSAARRKLRLLIFGEEACTQQVGGVGVSEISALQLQEYGSKPSAAAPYLGFRFELVTSVGTWVVAADTAAEKTRWVDELLGKAGIKLEDLRPSMQKWDHEGALETRKKNTSLGWKERYVRVRGDSFIVYREESSQIIKVS